MVEIEEVHEVAQDALELKEQGNREFKSGNYERAIESYDKVIELDRTGSDMRASVLFNKATCLFHLGKFAECIDSCSGALTLNPLYEKALYRRALAYEQINEFENAISDIEKMIELNPSHKSSLKEVYDRLKAKRDAKFESEKEKVFSELKGLGNSLLSTFGLSLDNFKMEKDPSTGSYSIKMNNG